MPNFPGSGIRPHYFDPLAELVPMRPLVLERPLVLRPEVPWEPESPRPWLKREDFKCKPGYVTCATDYSGMELRILAEFMADRSGRRQAMRSGFDLMYGMGSTVLPKARVDRDLLLQLYNDPIWNSWPTFWERLAVSG